MNVIDTLAVLCLFLALILSIAIVLQFGFAWIKRKIESVINKMGGGL